MTNWPVYPLRRRTLLLATGPTARKPNSYDYTPCRAGAQASGRRGRDKRGRDRIGGPQRRFSGVSLRAGRVRQPIGNADRGLRISDCRSAEVGTRGCAPRFLHQPGGAAKGPAHTPNVKGGLRSRRRQARGQVTGQAGGSAPYLPTMSAFRRFPSSLSSRRFDVLTFPSVPPSLRRSDVSTFRRLPYGHSSGPL